MKEAVGYPYPQFGFSPVPWDRLKGHKGTVAEAVSSGLLTKEEANQWLHEHPNRDLIRAWFLMDPQEKQEYKSSVRASLITAVAFTIGLIVILSLIFFLLLL